jgi:uncharacterized delta-60 repeat protein
LPFGSKGTAVVTTTFEIASPTTDTAYDMAIQDDSMIVVAGASNNNFALARYDSDGSLDTTFDTDGLVTTDLGGTDKGQAVKIQTNQKIVVAGSKDADFAFARYNPNGALDSTIYTGGIITTDFNAGSEDYGYDLIIQPNGKIIVGGYSQYNFALARYTITGTLDTTFGSGGKVTTDLGGNDYGYALALQEDGKIILAGTSNYGSYSYDFALARYTITGTLDTTFGTGGIATTDFSASSASTSSDRAYDVEIQNDGKIIAVGYSGDYWAIARYKPDGSPDTSFGTGGKANTLDEGFMGRAYDVTIQSDGKILLAGQHIPGNFGLVRYMSSKCFLPLVLK